MIITDPFKYQGREPKERVLYLDVDDTLIRFARPIDIQTDEDLKQWKTLYPRGMPAEKVAECLDFFHEHFEIRWLTMWCPSGQMRHERVFDLANILKIDPIMISWIENPKPFWGKQYDNSRKTNGIDMDDPRPWVWVEDDLPPDEIAWLQANGVFDNYIPCNVSTNRSRLIEVVDILKKRFNL